MWLNVGEIHLLITLLNDVLLSVLLIPITMPIVPLISALHYALLATSLMKLKEHVY